MQTRKRAKPVKFGIKKEEAPVEKEANVVAGEPQERDTKVVSHQEVIRVPRSSEEHSHEQPIIISQNVQITEEEVERDTEEDISVSSVDVRESASDESEEGFSQDGFETLEDIHEQDLEEQKAAINEEEEVPPHKKLFHKEERIEQERIEEEPEEEEIQPEVYHHKEKQIVEEEPESEEDALPARSSSAFVTKESSFGKGFKTPTNRETPREEGFEEEAASSEPRSSFSFGDGDYEEEKKTNPILFFITVVFVTFFLGLLFIGGVSYLAGDKSFGGISLPSFFAGSEPTPTPTEEPTPTPTPEEEVDLTAYTIDIENGSGITGEAANLKSALTTAGFTIGSVGNADSSDYVQTQITVKDTVSKGYIEALEKELQKTYAVETVSEDSAQATDVVIIIGSEMAN
ncbi:MAG: LytR C-terminal domain-containing protein [Patescibacteria group bacterium]|mgnify:CR=1 FL=1